jgi:hypothetical protein
MIDAGMPGACEACEMESLFVLNNVLRSGILSSSLMGVQREVFLL